MSEVVLGVRCTAQPDGRFAADGNVAVVVDGRPVFAVAQERVTRCKYDGGFVEAARYALDMVGMSIADVQTVAVSTFGRPNTPGDPEHAAVADLVRNALGDGPNYQVMPSHHLAHALSAAAQGGYERALVAAIDNEGSILGSRHAPSLWRHPLERASCNPSPSRCSAPSRLPSSSSATAWRSVADAERIVRLRKANAPTYYRTRSGHA